MSPDPFIGAGTLSRPGIATTGERPMTERTYIEQQVEALAAEFHEVYQVECCRQGRASGHPDHYNNLSEDIKELDRALARHVLKQRERDLRAAEAAVLKKAAQLSRDKDSHDPDCPWHYDGSGHVEGCNCEAEEVAQKILDLAGGTALAERDAAMLKECGDWFLNWLDKAGVKVEESNIRQELLALLRKRGYEG